MGEGDSKRGSVDSLQPSTPSTTYSPFTLTEPGLAPGLVSTHQDIFTFGQLEPAANGESLFSPRLHQFANLSPLIRCECYF